MVNCPAGSASLFILVYQASASALKATLVNAPGVLVCGWAGQEGAFSSFAPRADMFDSAAFCISRRGSLFIYRLSRSSVTSSATICSKIRGGLESHLSRPRDTQSKAIAALVRKLLFWPKKRIPEQYFKCGEKLNLCIIHFQLNEPWLHTFYCCSSIAFNICIISVMGPPCMVSMATRTPCGLQLLLRAEVATTNWLLSS